MKYTYKKYILKDNRLIWLFTILVISLFLSNYGIKIVSSTNHSVEEKSDKFEFSIKDRHSKVEKNFSTLSKG